MNGDWLKKNRVRISVAAAAAIAAAILVIALAGGDDEPEGTANGAEIVSANELRERAAEQGTPVYWAGERVDTELELSGSGGQTYVRYLTHDADAGDPRPDFLTVGTYEMSDPVAALRRQNREPGGVLAKAPGGAVVYFSRTAPHSVYLAYPGVAAEIEVYDPNFKRALGLVNSGQVVPVG
jgi:hypothetical protein